MVKEPVTTPPCIAQHKGAAEEVYLARIEGHIEWRAEFLQSIDDFERLPQRNIRVIRTLQNQQGPLDLIEMLHRRGAIVELRIGDRC